MATIYKKIVNNYIGYDQCIVLENREAFLYPIPNQIMNNWSEIRIGFICTLTSTSGDGLNSPMHTYKNVGFSSVTKESSHFFGLKTNNNELPYSNNCSFIGIAPLLNKSSNLDFYNQSATLKFSSNNSDQITCLFSSGSSYQTGCLDREDWYSPDGYGITLGTYYSNSSEAPFVRFAMKILKTGNNNLQLNCARETIISAPISPSPTNDASISGLRDFMLSFGSVSASQRLWTRNNLNQYNGIYFTSDQTPSGSPIQIPDSLFFYWPYTGSKLRIHNFCIEKYA